ncbi:MAG TPA: deoxyguanosinetriphosphate triphosphohydrolase [Firmicutes bacterium]|nr:deoxyguanosinetriphosphate triphosphohydrolase [Bacillota bacterium]
MAGVTVREQTEELERMILSPRAALAVKSAGRVREEAPCPIRTVYQRDRDRILHCNAFRRLKHKTQVFLAPEGDHYRTRLTHTLEVSQIARTIVRGLRLNEDLTEAIALGHDLGHTPFGHAGERALQDVCPHGFRHNQQSLRVVEYLEHNGQGLNLTREVREGILNHNGGDPGTLEGQVVALSDQIAYINHDIEDAVRAGVLRESDLPWDCIYVLGRHKSERLSVLIASVIAESGEQIRMSPEVMGAHQKLRKFMFDTVYLHSVAKQEEGKADGLIKDTYAYLLKHPDRLPAFYRQIAKEQDIDRAVCDYIAGMTDRYMVSLYTDLFIPKSWSF